ncbi:MAG: VWA domain-containing protein, partial [Gammaproteobacteria bacterium]|nr:VWA domain-containing protein [Gammaproteobacteria bacterium]
MITDWIQQLEWRHPLWFYLALYPWLVWILRRVILQPRNSNYAEAALLPWVVVNRRAFQLKQLWRPALLVFSWTLLAAGLAGPRIPEQILHQDKSRYLQLMIVLDVSRSMTARDVAPGRLARAKLEIDDLLQRTDRVKIGIMLYAGKALLLVPPTSDKTVLRHYLAQIRYGLIPLAGSDLDTALRETAQVFTNTDGNRVLLLITDGETGSGSAQEQVNIEATAKQLHDRGIRIYALGVGTTDGSALFDHDGNWLQHENLAVTSTLQRSLLTRLTQLGNGRYADLAETDAEWLELYDRGIARIPVSEKITTDKQTVIWREVYGWFLFPAMLLLLAGQWQPRLNRFRSAGAILICLLGPGMFTPQESIAADTVSEQTAYQAFQREDYIKAGKIYAQLGGFHGRFGEGSSAYKLGQYAAAIQQFTQAFLDADNDQQRSRALFNLANCHYQLNEFETAVALYQDVLHYTPNHRSAITNLGYARELHQKSLQQPEAVFTRPGRGPARGRPPAGTEITQGGLSLDDPSTNDQTIKRSAAAGPQPADMIERGIRDARPADRSVQETADTQWHYDPTSVESMSAYLETLSVDESVIWQRIFE